ERHAERRRAHDPRREEGGARGEEEGLLSQRAELRHRAAVLRASRGRRRGQDFGQVREGRAFAVAAQVEGGEGEGKEDPDRVEVMRDRTADVRELVVRRRRATSRESGRAVKSRPPRGTGRRPTA